MDDSDLLQWLASLNPICDVPTLAEMEDVARVLGLDVAGVARLFTLNTVNGDDSIMDVLMPDGSSRGARR
jgi:hypothetical protein